MWFCRFIILFGTFLCPLISSAADIEGKVVVKKQLTKRKVTPSAGTYDRGPTVGLTSTPLDDELSFERMHVAVYLEGPMASKPVMATLEQKNRQFKQDLLVIPAGSTVSFPNLDPIFHNVFSLSKPKSFDLGNYPRNQTRVISFPTQESFSSIATCIRT